MPAGPPGGGLEFPEGPFTGTGDDLNLSKIVGFVPRETSNGVITYEPITESRAALQYVETTFFRVGDLGNVVADAICECYKDSMKPTYDRNANTLYITFLVGMHELTGLAAKTIVHVKFGFGSVYNATINGAYEKQGIISPEKFAVEYSKGKAISTNNVYSGSNLLYTGSWIQEKRRVGMLKLVNE